MSENIQSISQGTYTIGQTSATNFVAGPGIKIDQPSEGVVRIGNDETVLYSGNATTAFTLSEPLTSFEKIQLGVVSNGERAMVNLPVDAPVGYTLSSTLRFGGINFMHSNDGAPLQTFGAEYSSNNGTSFSAVRGLIRAFYYTGSGMWFTTAVPGIYKVIGINRKEV